MTVDVIQDTAEDRLLEFTRRVNSDLVVEIISVDAETADFDESDLTELTAKEDGNGYKSNHNEVGPHLREQRSLILSLHPVQQV